MTRMTDDDFEAIRYRSQNGSVHADSDRRALIVEVDRLREGLRLALIWATNMSDDTVSHSVLTTSREAYFAWAEGRK